MLSKMSEAYTMCKTLKNRCLLQSYQRMLACDPTVISRVVLGAQLFGVLYYSYKGGTYRILLSRGMQVKSISDQLH